jgi:F0F1-type ATP synthase membrane subunit c/vacuolar-type H+-ATPase subunit K
VKWGARASAGFNASGSVDFLPSAAEGIARQPEAAGSIQTASIIFAALIEGVALFGLVITLLYKLL